jgi:hypothetical protein
MRTSLFKRYYSLTIALLGFSIISCEKRSYSPVITLEVLSQGNVPEQNVKISLLTDSPTPVSEGRLKTTSETGKAVFFLGVDPKAKYVAYIWHENAAKDLYLTNSEATFMAKGSFQSQQEIDASAKQIPQPQIGDTKYIDLNTDGVINQFDKALPLGDISVGEIQRTLYVKEK